MDERDNLLLRKIELSSQKKAQEQHVGELKRQIANAAFLHKRHDVNALRAKDWVKLNETYGREKKRLTDIELEMIDLKRAIFIAEKGDAIPTT